MTDPRNYTLERDQEIIPVVRKILKALAEREDLMMGSSQTVTTEGQAEYYAQVYKEVIVPLFMEHNIKLNDISAVFQFLMQPAQMLDNVTSASFDANKDIADGFKYGIKDIDDMRVMDLDNALKAGFAEKMAKVEEAK